MAGKPKGTWGGAREGSGPKPKKKEYSESVKNAYMVAAEKLAKKHKKPIEEALLSMVYDKDVQDSVKASIMKTYNEAMIIKATEKTVKDNRSKGPTIFRVNEKGEKVVVEEGIEEVMLPERKPDPAKEIH